MKTEHEGNRYKALLKSTGIPMGDIATMLDMTAQGLNYHLRKEEVTEDFKGLLKKIFPDYFQSLKANESSVLNEPGAEYKPNLTKSISVPVYDVEFSAGVMASLVESREDHFPVGFLSIPQVSGCDAIIKAKGDSMADRINDGDWIGIKRIHNWDEWLPMDYIYAITTDHFELIKYIRKGNTQETFKLVSHNEFYAEDEIPKKLIKEIWSVKAVLPFSKIETLI